MERERARLLAVTGLPMDALIRDYVYVRLGDLASLAFCNAWTEPQMLGPWTVRLLDERRAHGRAQPVRARRAVRDRGARCLPGRSWASDAELQAAFHAAPTLRLAGLVVGRTRTS